MFKKNKKLVAVILAVALALASVSAVSAAKSPTKNDPKPGKQKVKSKDQDTTEVLVDKGKGITAIKIANVKKATVGGTVKVGTVNGKTTNVPVDSVGTKALDGNKKTTKLTTTKTVTTIKSKALVGSKVKDVVSKVSKKSTLVLKSESLAGCSSLKTFEANGDKKAEDGAVEFG